MSDRPAEVRAARNERQRLQQSRAELSARLSRVYTPSTPITDPDLFAGRREVLDRAGLLVGKAGTTMLIHGERGVGKTSFVNVLLGGGAPSANLKVTRHTCSVNDTFVSIFRGVLARVGELFTVAEASSSTGGDVELGIPTPGLTIRGNRTRGTKTIPVAPDTLDLNFLLDRLARREGEIDAVVLDEFERMSNEQIRDELMEVVKGIADRGLRTLLVLVGVADEPDELVRDFELARYGRRNLTAIKLPRLSDDEALELIAQRRALGVDVDEDAAAQVIRVACGLPFLIHHLAYEAGLCWVGRWAGVAIKPNPSMWQKLGLAPREEQFNVAGVNVRLTAARRAPRAG